MKKNILVFPCGSEIALEIYRSMQYSAHFHLIGASSVDDHGMYVYDDYIGDVPYVDDIKFISSIRDIVVCRQIEAVYPAMDLAIYVLKKHECEIGCKVIASEIETVEICLSKVSMYNFLESIVSVPKLYNLNSVYSFPVFCKPDVGYGARRATRIDNQIQLKEHVESNPDTIICEYLSGDEFTVDCFTKSSGELLFCAPRIRKRIMNGISVNTVPYDDKSFEFRKLIERINNRISFKGAWFAQFKRNSAGKLVLLEISARFGGSSSLYRGLGVNFAQLTLFDSFGHDVNLILNNYNIQMDRALDNKYLLNLEFNEVFVDYDDCIIIDDQYVNTDLVAFLFQCINNRIKISLLTKHKKDIKKALEEYRLLNVFDRIIQIEENSKKSDYIDNGNAIFIDDSFSERKDVLENNRIPVFSLDMIQCLQKS